MREFIAKIKNLVYYRSIDERPRATYIHVVRSIRKEAILLKTENNSLTDKENKLLDDIINSINPKIKTEDCTDYILVTLKQIISSYEQ